MIYLVIYVFAAFGLAYIIGHASISKRVRERLYGAERDLAPIRWTRETFVELLECPACLGFWIGFAAYYAHLYPIPLHTRGWAAAFVCGLFTAGTNYVLAKITRLID